MSDFAPTRITLIQRVKNPDDQAAWTDFCEYYSGFITMLLNKMKVPNSLHHDLTQELMLKLWKSIKSFDVDDSRARFRTWLGKVLRNSVIDYMRSENARKNREFRTGEEDNYFNILAGGNSDLDKVIHQEWTDYMLNQAIEHLKSSFSGNAIEVFMMSSQGNSVKEISQNLSIPANTVYVLRSRVKAKFMAELKQLRELFEF
ncbi:sigma-70 family RNA polymerase sigma factor [Lentisphaera marina]|uniref:RNA polymerase sigma factor n=1 Tax=Lentisphaera marina TaxID=1111041 RepID=UPI0023654B34|nr:sigma-70 family RNA polymerase sigma factor [Lentisphaera marina]MDD7985213.1 sigma-70 family RNA polymerase sigma factor [Lentisphaera marina]